MKSELVSIQNYGFNSPDYQCAAYIASGVAKHLTTSKTMNVEEVTDLHSVLRTITKHFESSIKNIELYDECLSILKIKPIHMILWCQTRMGYFFKVCTACNNILPTLYNVVVTANIHVEERNMFFTAKNMYNLKMVSNIEPYFSKKLLHSSDMSSLFVSTVYN